MTARTDAEVELVRDIIDISHDLLPDCVIRKALIAFLSLREGQRKPYKQPTGCACDLDPETGSIIQLCGEHDAAINAAYQRGWNDCEGQKDQGEAVGEAGSMPGTDGFTMAAFKASDVPLGTKLYTAPPAKPQSAVTREAIAKIISGAPFPSERSLVKADAILALLQGSGQ